MSTWTRGRTACQHRHSEPGGVCLFWIPLGAGGSGFVRMNGRIYEVIKAGLQRRRPLAIYHTALQVRVPEGDFIVETTWPSPDHDLVSRGVLVEGPVFAEWLSVGRAFRYEVRCWKDGDLPDAAQAIGGPQRVSGDLRVGRRLLDLVGSVPCLTWGRDPARLGDMWNSNSVISWLLTMSGLPMDAITPPEGGRAPGWDAGVAVAGQGSNTVFAHQMR